ALWKDNPERGLYKSVDGGRTWALSKFVSDKAISSDGETSARTTLKSPFCLRVSMNSLKS
ncbi:MAG TPA: hypothetical protein VFF54_05885, partial [Thermodesulfobacteriota bacterium]|nr:hypothetical protein [Thermodesulfobacteriota bacterium]